MSAGEKLRQIREGERLTQRQMATDLGMSLDTLKNYELARRPVGAQALFAVTQHPKFTKYTLWLMADQTAPAAGQVSPV
jgi:transcriptional regulator with XRE-family HTH domain